MSKNTFKKGERLKSRSEISRLFSGGSQSFSQYPLRLVWAKMDIKRSDFPIQVSISVPKKRFKKAVDRNRIRRHIQEAYRLHKSDLYTHLAPDNPQMAWVIIYTGKEKTDFQKMNQTMDKLMKRFLQKSKNSE